MSNPERSATGGSDSRPARTLDRPLTRFDLRSELQRLSGERAGHDADRQAITLAKSGSLRLVLATAAAGTTVGGDETNGALTIQVLRGAVVVARDADETRLEPEQVAVIAQGGPWRARAESDAVLLLTLSWPPEAADLPFAR